MNIWFTADQHLGHQNIIRHCNRPFQTIQEMDDTLIANWNSRVARGDLVYHVGDIIFRSANHPIQYLRRLNGKIHLFRGNHDRGMLKQCSQHFVAIDDLKTIKVDGEKIVLCHYAMRVWDSSHRGALHLFGHSHGRLPPYGLSFDVGVDSHDFHVWSWDEIKAKMATLAPAESISSPDSEI